jgi:hypothetical protein
VKRQSEPRLLNYRELSGCLRRGKNPGEQPGRNEYYRITTSRLVR